MYYLGFLKHNYKDVMVFRSVKKPVSKDYTYFVRVMGPYRTEMEARASLHNLQRIQGYQGYKENPSRETIRVSKENIKRAIALTRKVMKLYGAIRKKNPGKAYHDGKFIEYLKELDKYMVGSSPYIATLAKAYEHLQSAKDSIEDRRQTVRS